MMVDIANGALLEGDPTGALQNLRQAESYDPNLAQIYHSRAIAFFRKNDLISAVQSARRAVEILPAFSDANNTLGRLLMDLGKYDEAIKPLQLAANDSFYRDAYKAWTNLGILKYNQGEYLVAEAFLTRAIVDSPQSACVAHYYRGQIEVQDTRVKEAIGDFHEATKRFCAHFADAHLALGMAFQKNRQYEDARKTFLEIQKLYPNTKNAERALSQLKYLP
jgi:Tfp pilus assembly protein PilF